MVDNEKIAEFMGQVAVELRSINEKMELGNERFEKADLRMSRIEHCQQKTSSDVQRIYTSLHVGRWVGGLLVGIAGALGAVGSKLGLW